MTLIPHRTSGTEETTLPPDYQRILAAVQKAAGPVMARQVGDTLGVDVSMRAKLEPLRGKLVGPVDRGWLRAGLRGEQGDQLVAPAADGGIGHVVPAGHVGQALVVTQHGQDDHRDPPGRQDPPPEPYRLQVAS
ncbi:hypothetical protein [Streptomyces sp. NPDC058240]|uniref:hypothetical protein n=1 Tax=Streptomyces sp. NPDC058240 TaxID=3346396 RepID=UPI0036E4D3ED